MRSSHQAARLLPLWRRTLCINGHEPTPFCGNVLSGMGPPWCRGHWCTVVMEQRTRCIVQASLASRRRRFASLRGPAEALRDALRRVASPPHGSCLASLAAPVVLEAFGLARPSASTALPPLCDFASSSLRSTQALWVSPLYSKSKASYQLKYTINSMRNAFRTGTIYEKTFHSTRAAVRNRTYVRTHGLADALESFADDGGHPSHGN